MGPLCLLLLPSLFILARCRSFLLSDLHYFVLNVRPPCSERNNQKGETAQRETTLRFILHLTRCTVGGSSCSLSRPFFLEQEGGYPWDR